MNLDAALSTSKLLAGAAFLHFNDDSTWYVYLATLLADRYNKFNNRRRLSSLPVNDEFGLIRQWTNPYQTAAMQKSLGVVVGIGDDAAVVEMKAGFQLVLSSDTMVQDIHFNEKTMRMSDVGFKAMAAALSDLSAMGAIPKYALVSLTLPKNADITLSKQLYEGLYACADQFGVAIVGGDTTSTLGGWVVTIQVTGEIEAGMALLRSTASPGDIVFITGPLGCSAAGLDYLNTESPLKLDLNQSESIERLIEKHRRPLPQILAGRTLLHSGSCHALNDISDGLASEAWEIAEASKVGILLNEAMIPRNPDLILYAELAGKSAMDWILYGGEEYQLIGTAPKSQVAFIEQEFKKNQLDYHIIGEVTELFAGVRLLQLDDIEVEIAKKGYNHFA
ncbi:thiamine-phosphate kinase [Paenibacillus psychroresistens]|uniref:Thiamine-monophosphate kinase n=1 Tax=Paenibacillus psychroresistens TaxID=1778678 RepID=A0A6B8RSS6_9BACL|nr:thiamine-phosphate kinase [Paenibacillus psychroresistens]QGQ98513.1 thiamine-phosphate kinase [Paenibacillus psychroresistens]